MAVVFVGQGQLPSEGLVAVVGYPLLLAENHRLRVLRSTFLDAVNKSYEQVLLYTI
jgi:hypothetical protein